MESSSAADRGSIISRRQLILIAAFYIAFALLLVGANRLALGVCQVQRFDCPEYFPLSVFNPRNPGDLDILTALLALVFFMEARKLLVRERFALPVALACGLLLVCGTNLIQGTERSFAVPIAGNPGTWTMTGVGHEYYYDALAVTDSVAFIRDYEQLQPDLYVHTKTHPPGAVLTLWWLERISPDPTIIGLTIATISVLLSGIWLHAILKTAFDTETSGYGVWLFLLLPAVQIYYAASLDALIAAFLLGALYGIIFARHRAGQVIGFMCLLAASWLTFGFTFLLVVLAFDALRRRNFSRLIVALLVLLIGYGALYQLFGFDYLAIFRQASLIENPGGFRLLANPTEYFFTRLEDILEILLFFTPVLILTTVWGFRVRSSWRTLSSFGIAALLLMLATGAFRTGETARACLFIYPYLLFPALNRLKAKPAMMKWVAALVFVQVLVMQLFGGYFW